MLCIINRNRKYLNNNSFVLLYKSMVKSYLDYCSSVWAPYKKVIIEMLEKVQKGAIKRIPEFKKNMVGLYIDRFKL